MSAFDTWVAFLGPTEGTLSLDPADTGNWRNGELVGTKYGISAAAHPDVDIRNLTLDEANVIRREQYWDAVRADDMPAPLALMLADAAYGSGPITAIRHLQAALGVAQDGIIGPQTMGAVARAGADSEGMQNLLAEFASRRLLYEASLSSWSRYQGGWTRRLFRSVLIARALAEAPHEDDSLRSVADEVERMAEEFATLRAHMQALAG